jgi:hypothetical protein
MKNFLEDRLVVKSENHQNGNGSPGNGFQPLFTMLRGNGNGNGNGNGHGVIQLNGHAHAGAAGTDCSQEAPQVELVTEDGKIRRIIITCVCSRRIELECEY